MHMVTELLLMTQLRTQLTKLVFSLPFIQKKQVHQLTALCGSWRLITHYSKHFRRLARIYTPGTSLSMPTLLLWLELQLLPPHLTFTSISTYPCEFPSQSPDFSYPTLKNPLDQQSIRLTVSSILYTNAILLLQSTRSRNLGSIVLSCIPAQSNASSSNCITGYCHGELSKKRDHPNPWKSLSTVGKMEKAPRPSAFMETLSATPASYSLQQWYCGAPSYWLVSHPREPGQDLRQRHQNPAEKWMPSWTGSPGCPGRASANSMANCQQQV